MKVAVVHNTKKDGVINFFGQPCPENYAPRHIQLVIDALREAGHLVASVEGDKTMLATLEQFMPPCPETGRPTGIVFNMAYGLQGECRYTHVPAMLEMAGIPYTGSSPMGHALALDKVITKVLMQNAGIPTPAYQVMGQPGQSDAGLTYPLVVKPVHESTSYGLRLVYSRQELDEAVEVIVQTYRQPALVEDYIDGREVCVALLGNDPIEALPIVELDFGQRQLKLNTWDDKFHKRVDEPTKICPAPLDEHLADRLREIAVATFRACHLKDYARVDIRIDKNGRPFVLEINSMASLGDGGSYMKAAMTAGYTHAQLVNRILDVTHRRYFGTDAPRSSGPCAAPTSNAVDVPLAVV